jgi:hypothetical protein
MESTLRPQWVFRTRIGNKSRFSEERTSRRLMSVSCV